MENTLPPRHVFLAQTLCYAATLPVIAGVIVTYFRFDGIDAPALVRLYTAILIAFLGGIHWAASIAHGPKCPRNMLITSTATAFLAWTSLMLPQVKLTLALESLTLLYLLVLDYKLKEAKLIPVWFYALRHNVTAIMVISLMMIELS